MIWLAAGILLLAFLLVFLELMVPSFGLLAVAAVGAFITAAVLAFLESTVAGFIFVGVIVVGVPLVLYFGVRLFQVSPLGRRMILRGPEETMSGGAAALEQEAPEVGMRGVTHTMLRPVGVALFGGRRMDVTTEGRILDAGVPVVIIKVEGARIVVRETDEPDEASGAGNGESNP